MGEVDYEEQIKNLQEVMGKYYKYDKYIDCGSHTMVLKFIRE